MLSRHAEVGDMAKMLLEEVAIAARDDVHDVLGVGAEGSKRLEETL